MRLVIRDDPFQVSAAVKRLLIIYLITCMIPSPPSTSRRPQQRETLTRSHFPLFIPAGRVILWVSSHREGSGGHEKCISGKKKKEKGEMRKWKDAGNYPLILFVNTVLPFSSHTTLQFCTEVNSWLASEGCRAGPKGYAAKTAITLFYPSANKHNGREEAVATCQKSTGS